MTKRANSYIPPVDLSRLKRIASETKEGLPEVVDYYVQVTKGQLQKLDRAVHLRSGTEVKTLAHSCIGASTLLGMRAIVIPLRQLEEIAVKKQWKGAATALAEARKELEGMQSFLKMSEEGKEDAQSTDR